MKTLIAALVSGLVLVTAACAQEPVDVPAELNAILDRSAALEPLETVVIARNGQIVAERGYRGHAPDKPTNIKSASKTVLSGLIGMAIDRGELTGVDQPIATLLARDLPPNGDPRLKTITIGHLLSMQAGLTPTSGANYGAWVASPNWVRAALAQPFADDPGAGMLYSTGSSHLLSAALTAATGRSSLANARDWLGKVDRFSIAAWERDPQGVYLGGNQMAMSPRALLAFGEIYRSGGLAPNGERVLSQAWIDRSWTARTASRYTGDGYGYGWFLRRIGAADVRYAWGYGGQMLYVVPELGLTVVMTSDENSPAARTGHRDDLHALLAEVIGVARRGGG